MGFLGRVRFLGRSPLTIVELIIGIGAIVGGLYLVSPFLPVIPAAYATSMVGEILTHPVALFIFGAVYTASGLSSVVGIISRRTTLRSVGMFWNILCRTYGLCTIFILAGFLPLTWLPSATVLLIAVVVYIWLRGLILRGIEP